MKLTTSKTQLGLRIALAALAIVGACFAVRSSLRLSEARSQYRRLSGLVGELPVSDVDQVWIRAIPTEEKWSWQFRVYLPAPYDGRISHVSGNISASTPRARAHVSSSSSQRSRGEPSEFLFTA